MKKIITSFLIIILLIGCNPTQKTVTPKLEDTSKTSETVKIANEELEYEVIIIDPGFNSFLYGQAKPRNYYSEEHLKSRNQIWVREWNNRVRQPMNHDPNLYMWEIDYDSSINYGYEVNYLIYNYLVYFQMKNNIQFSGFVPRP
jgi:hypothetical protein